MSNVLVNKDKIDILANAISVKSGEPLTLTLDEMVEAVDGIEVGGGITPTGNIDITQAGTTDVTNYATATVPSADPWLEITTAFSGSGNSRTWTATPKVLVDVAEGDTAGFMADGYEKSGTDPLRFNAVPSNTTITPSTSSQTIGGTNYMMEGAVTVAAMPSGTAGTPTATKGAVSNHLVSVTPSVTNTEGYISGGTINGTAVTVSASELVSGSQTVTENGTVDVTNFAEVVVDVSGGGSSGVSIGTATRTLSASASSIQFTGLSGNPTSFIITSSGDVATNTNGVTAVAYDGTNLNGQTMTTQVEADTGFTKSYSGGTLTVTASTASFVANTYKLVYTYGGSSSDIHTADVQVGSGATSITFPVSGRPQYWSCVFKSDFSTSSGYQRVIAVANDGSSTYGLAMDSSAHASTAWTATYSGGNLTITSQGTNNGGYFHQPGYYQLTYSVDDSAPTYQTKTVRPTTSQQTVTADSGYDALEEVTVTAVSQTNLTADNIKSGTTVTISNGQSNLWSVTGTYSGGGGSSKNVQVLQSTSRVNSTSLAKALGDLTVSKTGTYDIYWSGGRTNTSSGYTWGTRLYIDGTGYGTENTSWTNNCQSNHLSNVSLTANQKLSVYSRGRSGNSYYSFVPMLVIVEA